MRLFSFLLSSVLLSIVMGCTAGNPGEKSFVNKDYGPIDPSYVMDVQYDSMKHEINGYLSVEFTNNLEETLHEVYFNLWPKADDFAGGDIEVSHVQYNGEKATMNIDNNHLQVSGFSLPPNERAKVSMRFTVQIPEQQHRFGWSGSSVTLGNWFPILAVYDTNGWNLHPYFEAGESFYSLTGDYEVTITTDDDMVVAATGEKTGEERESHSRTKHHFKAENVRDFAMQMDRNYLVETIDVDDTKMNVYYTEEQASRGQVDFLVDGGKQALQTFNKKVGKYAWDELSIVAMSCEFGGMEYPQLVMICVNDGHDEDYIQSIVAHEIGHQWFYSAVGNNQYREPWLDESFANFMEELSMGRLQQLADYEFAEPGGPYYVNAPISIFTEPGETGSAAYWEYIYGFGLKTLNDLRTVLGDDVFYQGLQQYYEEMKYKIATTADFIRIMEESAGQDLADFFEEHYIHVNGYNQ